MELLHGAPQLEEMIDGKTFRIPPNAFFQTNTGMAEKLVETARDFLSAKPPRLLLDLYCGVGLFGICLAGDAKSVLGVELDASAVAVASGNAERNGVKNARYVAGKAEDLAWTDETGGKPDTVIIDPPRAGLHPKVTAALLTMAPERLLYVSCNYESFARDFATLGRDYRITKIAALDLFPHSPHVETIALLERK
jgi:23S rRNA (uracil1939-C5)-methyltransferase